jgi:hypothetical protein
VPKKYKLKRVGGKIVYMDDDGLRMKYSDRKVELKDFLVDFDLFKTPKSKLGDK